MQFENGAFLICVVFLISMQIRIRVRNKCSRMSVFRFSWVWTWVFKKKGNSKFPFLEKHTIHISYRLFKLHHKVEKTAINIIFSSVLPPSTADVA